MQIKPTATKILVEENKQEEVRASGIIISANTTGTNTRSAKIVAVGDDVVSVKVGDDVYVDWTKGSMIKVDGRNLVFVESEFILGVVQ